MKKTKIRKPILYFSSNRFEESLLIKFQYLELEQKFVLILDYADLNTTGKTRGFRMLIFHKVSQFIRNGNPEFLRKIKANYYSSKDNIRAHVIQNLELMKSGKKFSIDIWFDTYLGGVNFSFKEISEKTRIGIGIQNEDFSYSYIDSETKEQFDFYNPISEE